MSNIESLAQLEVDLASPEMARMHSRPTGDLKGKHLARWNAELREKLGGESSCEDLAKKLLGTKIRRDRETGLKELKGVPWPLSVPSMHHWSSKMLKNAKRDVPKHALMALIEVLVVSEYRPKLFQKSAATRFLRTRLKQVLEDGLKPKGSMGRQGEGRIKWTYADGIEWEPQNFISHSGARKLLLEHSRIAETKERGQEVVGLMNRILKHKAALMKPGDPEYSGIVAPEVAECAHNLLNVSCERGLTAAGLIRMISTQALKKNQARQWTMQSLEAASGDTINLEEWDQRLDYSVPNWSISSYDVWEKPKALEVCGA